MTALIYPNDKYKVKIVLDNGEKFIEYGVHKINENLYERITGLYFYYMKFDELILVSDIFKFKNLLSLTAACDNVNNLPNELANFIYLQTLSFTREREKDYRPLNSQISYYINNENMMMINYYHNIIIPEHVKNLNYTLSENICNIFFDQVSFLQNLPNTLDFLQVKIYHECIIVKYQIFNNLPVSLKKLIIVLDDADDGVFPHVLNDKNILIKYGKYIKIPFDCELIIKYNNIH